MKLGLIGAMDEEILKLKQHMDITKEVTLAGIHYIEGQFHDKEVVVCKSGVGKVNAAVCTQLLIDRFGVSHIIFTGVAGALDPALDIGDIVISSDCIQHDMDVTALGFNKGMIPFAPKSTFTADEKLAQLAFEASEEIHEGHTLIGRILSGDQFIASRGTVQMLREEMNGTCTEMEGAAVGQVCEMNGVPFVIIRSMSDRADGTAHTNFAEFTQLASDNSYRIVEALVKKL